MPGWYDRGMESLWHAIIQEPYGLVMVIAIVTLMVLAALLGWLIYRRRLHPVFLWLTFALGFFGFSQSFAENRDQRRFLAVSAAVSATVLTWFVMRVVRQEQRKRQRSSGVDSNRATPRVASRFPRHFRKATGNHSSPR